MPKLLQRTSQGQEISLPCEPNQCFPLNILPSDPVNIVLDFCASSICAEAIPSSNWYKNLFREFRHLILPIQSTINFYPTNNHFQACKSIAQQINILFDTAISQSFFDKTIFPEGRMKKEDFEDLDLAPKIPIIERLINRNLIDLFNYVNWKTPLNHSFKKLLKEENIEIRAKNIREWLNNSENQDELKKIIKIEDSDYCQKLIILPSEISCFINLQKLVLVGKGLHAVPDSISQLRNLQELNLDQNKLQQVPESIGELRNLTDLSLACNKLNQIFDSIGKLVKLKALCLSANELTQIPDSFGNLVELEELNLADNKFQRIPESICRLANLRILWLASNDLHDVPDSLCQLINLQQLSLSYNKLRQIRNLGTLFHLVELRLSGNELYKVPEFIGKLRNLKILSLDNNKLHQVPQFLKKLGKLQILTLCHNHLEQFPFFLGNLKHLKELSISNNELNQLSDFTHWMFANLRTLNLSRNKLCKLPGSLMLLQNLENINFNHNPLQWLPNTFRKLIDLKNFSYWANKEIIDRLIIIESREYETKSIIETNQSSKANTEKEKCETKSCEIIENLKANAWTFYF